MVNIHLFTCPSFLDVDTMLCISLQSPFIAMMNANYCNLEEQTLTLLLRSVRANCGLKVLKLVGNNLTGKGTFILSEFVCECTCMCLS